MRRGVIVRRLVIKIKFNWKHLRATSDQQPAWSLKKNSPVFIFSGSDIKLCASLVNGPVNRYHCRTRAGAFNLQLAQISFLCDGHFPFAEKHNWARFDWWFWINFRRVRWFSAIVNIIVSASNVDFVGRKWRWVAWWSARRKQILLLMMMMLWR